MEIEAGKVYSRLPIIMGEKRYRLVDVINTTGVGRASCARVYNEKDLEKMPLATFLKLCDGLNCELSDLIQYKPLPKEEVLERRTKEMEEKLAKKHK